MNNLTQQQRNDAERIARHLCHKKKAENDNVSGIALALLQTIGATRFKRAVLFQLKQITLGITGKAPGRDFLSGGKTGTGIDSALQNLLETAWARMVRDEVVTQFLGYVNEQVDENQFAWACLFSAGDQTVALDQNLVQHETPDQDDLNRRTARMKDREIPFDQVDAESDAEEEEDDDDEVVVIEDDDEVEAAEPAQRRRRLR